MGFYLGSKWGPYLDMDLNLRVFLIKYAESLDFLVEYGLNHKIHSGGDSTPKYEINISPLSTL